VCLLPAPVVAGITPEQLSLISRFAVSSIGSQGTVGGLVVAGIVSVSQLLVTPLVLTNAASRCY